MFYETAQTIGPGWHGKSFKPSHYDDMSWTQPTSARHFRSPGSSPTFRRRIINYDEDDDDDSDPHMFRRRNPAFEREFFDDVWNDHRRRKELFEDRPDLFRRTVKRDWDKDVEDFETSLRRDRDFRSEYADANEDAHDENAQNSNNGRVHHIPILVERRRQKMEESKPCRSGRSSSPPCSEEQEHFVDESEEWLRNHMDRMKQNFDSGFSTLQNRHTRHRLPRVDLNCRPRAFTSPIPDWGPENVHTLPTRKLHSRVVLDEKRNPKSVFRSYSETQEDIPREHPTASRSHSDSHCPKTTYVTKVSVNMPSEEKTEEPRASEKHEEDADRPVPPQRRARCRPRKEEDDTTPVRQRQRSREKKNSGETSTLDDETSSNLKGSQSTESDSVDDNNSKTRKNSLKNEKGSTALMQISAVLQNVEDLQQHVEAYNGNGRDKQFRFLDEMLTRCMLRLDDVDTDGVDDVRNARKSAVRKVLACIEKLESRAMDDKPKENDHITDNNNKNEEPGDEAKPAESVPLEDSKPSCEKGPEEPLTSASDVPSSDEAEQTRL